MSEEGGARTDPADRTEAAYETLLNARSIEIEGATLAKILLLLRKVVNSQSNSLLLVGKAVTQELSGEDLR
ncbi:hypothetical protein [Aurantimonas sp. Leaf443]|uniref:hypothetical protein n=1 Tax=Aurantimonas sp. Leaf443 TaxID=1736378 RepID=UPI0007007E8A|nr:hypothetical protein [Aurantimonas sp. Leaf443]KQT83986.1 hypothetical protein ASG48_11425 [Aurantimonas sp. Leaf443]